MASPDDGSHAPWDERLKLSDNGIPLSSTPPAYTTRTSRAGLSPLTFETILGYGNSSEPSPRELDGLFDAIHPNYQQWPLGDLPPQDISFPSLEDYWRAIYYHRSLAPENSAQSPPTVNPSDLRLDVHGGADREYTDHPKVETPEHLSCFYSEVLAGQEDELSMSFMQTPLVQEGEYSRSVSTQTPDDGSPDRELGRQYRVDPITKRCFCLIIGCFCLRRTKGRGYKRVYEWRRAHERRFYPCPYCIDIGYTRSRALERHIQLQHS